MWTRHELNNGGSGVGGYSQKSYVKRRAYLTSSFALDAITM